MKHKIIFQPSGRRGEVEAGKTILQASRELGVDIEGVCGEKKKCGKCKVRIEPGFFERYGIESKMEHLTPLGLTEEELKFIKTEEEAEGYRLGCVVAINGDVLVFVPEESRAGKQVVRKAATERAIKLDPNIKKYYVELPPPSLHEAMGDWERLIQELKKTYGLEKLAIDYFVLKDMPIRIRQGKWNVTVTIWNGNEVVKIEPGFVEKGYGLAIDIGTTTVAAYLCDVTTGSIVAVDSMMNPQVPYGEDVMSRITYSMMHKDGLEKLNKAMSEGLNKIIQNVSAEAGITSEDICEMTIVGNTAMHHLFMNIYPEHIGVAPFPPTLHHSFDAKARDLGLKISEGAYVHVLPIEAGFVGADNVGVLIAEEPYNQDKMALTIDIGTNGELVLGNRQKLISSSCATGPALEGAHIKFGMRAAPGAIERIKIDPETREVKFKVIGKEEWNTEIENPEAKGICGSGIIDAVAEMFRTGVILKNGNLNMNVKSPRIRKENDIAEFVIAWANETSIGRDITMSVKDVRAVQLAKGALYSGAKLMMKRLGVTKLDKVILAGAFGSYINKESAMIIGMFPDCEMENVYAVGNAAGDGARIALLNKAKRDEANVIARQVEYVELAVDSTFQREFMESMHFPHMKDKFPHIQDILDAIPKS
jgi:uncharacterized 2Fe-2S/4Fe-4S cluster protein (DUF4445 family)